MRSFKFLRPIMFLGLLQLVLTCSAQTTATRNNSSKIDHSQSRSNSLFQKVQIDSNSSYNDRENKVFDIVFKLSEVQSLARYLEKRTKGKRHLQMLLASYDKQTKRYWVKVGEDNGYMFVTHYNFYVYRNPTRIFYLDIQDDKVISLQVWQQKTACNIRFAARLAGRCCNEQRLSFSSSYVATVFKLSFS